jgi:hypothetical protein
MPLFIVIPIPIKDRFIVPEMLLPPGTLGGDVGLSAENDAVVVPELTS